MNRIAQTNENCQHFSRRMQTFFSTYKLGDILRASNIFRERGISPLGVVMYLFCLVFRNISMVNDMNLHQNQQEFAKDTCYRLCNSHKCNWNRFTSRLSSRIFNQTILPSTAEERKTVFIVDDSVVERPKSTKVELLAKLYDHAKRKYTRGYRMLTLGISDGATFLPVNHCLLSSENTKNRLVEAIEVPKNSCGYERRQLAQRKATEVLPLLLREALAEGLRAGHILMDSWFCTPKVIWSIKDLGVETIGMVRKTSKIHYIFQGEALSCTQIYNKCKKRRGRSNYLLSVDAELHHQENAKSTPELLPIKLIFVRNRNKKNDYLVLLSTDTSLDEEEIIQLYGRRWDIEVFFKTCKSILRLTSECRSLSYDAMTAHVAIVFLRYMFLAVEARLEQDPRTAGPLFCLICDEIADSTFVETFEKLQLFLTDLLTTFNLPEKDICALFDQLIDALPSDLANLLSNCRGFKRSA